MLSGPIGTLAAVLQLDAPLPWLQRLSSGQLSVDWTRGLPHGGPEATGTYDARGVSFGL